LLGEGFPDVIVDEITVADLARKNLLRVDDDRLADCARDARGDEGFTPLESEDVEEDEGEYRAGDETERKIAHDESRASFFLPGAANLPGWRTSNYNKTLDFISPSRNMAAVRKLVPGSVAPCGSARRFEPLPGNRFWGAVSCFKDVNASLKANALLRLSSGPESVQPPARGY
jgi:hypothetical protein